LLLHFIEKKAADFLLGPLIELLKFLDSVAEQSRVRKVTMGTFELLSVNYGQKLISKNDHTYFENSKVRTGF
jgi:hypothetical protein